MSLAGPYPGYQAPIHAGGFSGPMPGMVGHESPGFTFVNKDGRIERIEKEPGTQLSKEEFDQIHETRQKVQSAVSQLRSPDADESKTGPSLFTPAPPLPLSPVDARRR